jgi:hypothetical protein
MKYAEAAVKMVSAAISFYAAAKSAGEGCEAVEECIETLSD